MEAYSRCRTHPKLNWRWLLPMPGALTTTTNKCLFAVSGMSAGQVVTRPTPSVVSAISWRRARSAAGSRKLQAVRAGQRRLSRSSQFGTVKFTSTVRSDAPEGAFRSDLSPTCWGSVRRVFANLTEPRLECCSMGRISVHPWPTGHGFGKPPPRGDRDFLCAGRRPRAHRQWREPPARARYARICQSARYGQSPCRPRRAPGPRGGDLGAGWEADRISGNWTRAE